MGIEFEIKFRGPETAQEQIRIAFPGEYREFQMETTYYDTLDWALSDRKITLRRRMENGESVCTVKTPLQGLGRGEWECRCEDIDQGIGELCKLGAPQVLLELTGPGVVPVCGARFRRLAHTLVYEGAELELALDRGVLLGGGQEIPLCEVEVELKSGEPEKAVAFAAVLAQRFRLQREEKSKFRRALDLAKGG